MQQTLKDLVIDVSKSINNGFCYCSKPYPCFINEAIYYLEQYAYPEKYEVVDIDSGKIIRILPRKGSKKRKPLEIKLWF